MRAARSRNDISNSSLSVMKRLAEIGIQVTHEPTEDFEAPTKQQLKRVIRKIEKSIVAGEDVLIHCGGGKGRTGTYLAAYELYKILHQNPQHFAARNDIAVHVNKRSTAMFYQIEEGTQRQIVIEYAAWVKETVRLARTG